MYNSESSVLYISMYIHCQKLYSRIQCKSNHEFHPRLRAHKQICVSRTNSLTCARLNLRVSLCANELCLVQSYSNYRYRWVIESTSVVWDMRTRIQLSCRVVHHVVIIRPWAAGRVDAGSWGRVYGAEITVHTIRLSPFLALELVRHTLPFLVLNLTRCSPPRVMFYSPRSAPSDASERVQGIPCIRWKMKRGYSIACKIYRVIRPNAMDVRGIAPRMLIFRTAHLRRVDSLRWNHVLLRSADANVWYYLRSRILLIPCIK